MRIGEQKLKSWKLSNVMRCGGDNLYLVSKKISFTCDQLLVGQKAEDVIRKTFPEALWGKDCFVCIGEMNAKCG